MKQLTFKEFMGLSEGLKKKLKIAYLKGLENASVPDHRTPEEIHKKAKKVAKQLKANVK